MGAINIYGLSFHYTGDMIFEDLSLELEKNDKAGMIGANGCGKTTLFKLIAGELAPVSGTIHIQKNHTIGYLHQDENISGNKRVYDYALEAFSELLAIEKEIGTLSTLISKESDAKKLQTLVNRQALLNDTFLDKGGVMYESMTRSVLYGLGFSDEQLEMSAQKLSGGQKTRLALGRLLLSRPDILLLDEPTNHLDFDSVSWLEDFLSGYPGLVLIVSHDRYFLDVVTNKTIEIENMKAYPYKGNYSVSRNQKASDQYADQRAYDKQAGEIRHLKEVIKKLKQFNREKSVKRARSFEKKLDRINSAKNPHKAQKKIHLDFSGAIAPAKDVLSIRELSKAYGDNTLFKDLDLHLHRKDRLFVTGPNGSGKSTLLKIITGKLPADSGTYRIGENIDCGYYDQEQTFTDQDRTLYDELYNDFPDMDQTQIRSALAGMLFTGDDHEKRIRHLSGGEKGRLCLLKLMLSSPDLLILDEPTNHLDIFARERLESALADYEGTMLVVSHDRYFVSRLCTKLLHLKDGKHKLYLEGYKDFLEDQSIHMLQRAKENNKKSDAKNAFLENKKYNSLLRKTASDIQKLKESIEKHDGDLERIDSDIALANEKGDYERLHSLFTEKEKTESLYLEMLEELHDLENYSKEIRE